MRKSQPVDALQSWRSSKSPSSLTCSGPCLFPFPPLMLGAHTTSKIACWDLPGPWLWSGPHRAPGCTACARTHQGSLQPSGEDSAARSCSRANHLGLPQPSPAISATCTLGLLTLRPRPAASRAGNVSRCCCRIGACPLILSSGSPSPGTEQGQLCTCLLRAASLLPLYSFI